MRGKHSHPTREGQEPVSEDRVELYRCRPPERLRVPILVQLSAVNNDIIAEAEIDMTLQGLKGGRAGGPSGMRVEDLKGWCREAKCEKDPEGKVGDCGETSAGNV